MNDNTNNSPTDNFTVPNSYIFCFQGQCPKVENCIHYFAGLHIDNLKIGTAVFPAAVEGNGCKWYKKLRKVKMAWGFNNLFENVKAKDAPNLRAQIKGYLGGNGTYYQYHHGVRQLIPEQQTWILRLFKRYGYTDNLQFDGYSEEYDW